MKQTEQTVEYLSRFDPYRDSYGWVSENPEAYAQRMQAGLLPHWPTELLIEWLHRHNSSADRYTFLSFEAMHFSRETWPLERIPNRGVFYDPTFCDNFTDVERRSRTPSDWLAQYMLEHGTWNTPIVLLDNQAGRIEFPNGVLLKTPFHLLEGHRRLSFLNGLRMIGKATATHDIWVAQLRAESKNKIQGVTG